MANHTKMQICAWKMKEEAPEQVSEMALTSMTEMVFGDDKRKPVGLEDLKGKYRSVVKLQMHFNGQPKTDTRWVAGSGWLIRPDLLVTAGHCVFDWENGLGRVQHVKAYVGYHGKALSTIRMFNSVHDFAFIQLEKPFVRVEPFKYEATPETGDAVIGVVGYPADKESGDSERGANMYFEFARVKYKKYARIQIFHVRRRDSNVAIATHVAGSWQANLASPIGTEFINPYTAIVHFLFDSAWPSGDNVRQGIELHDVPTRPTDEGYANVGTFPAAWSAAKATGSAISSNILTRGTLFKEPVGPPAAALAGTILGYTGMMCESAINTGGAPPTTLPNYSGYAERAVLGEAALQYLLDGQTLPGDVMAHVFDRMKTRYQQLHPPVMPAAPRLLRGTQGLAVRIALNLLRVSKGGDPTPESRPTPVHPKPSSESAMDSDAEDFQKRLLCAMSKKETNAVSFLDTVLNFGSKVPGPIGLACTGLSFLSSMLQSESAMEDNDEDQALRSLASRAILGEAALDAFIHTDHQTLESEDFFSFIRNAARDLEKLVLPNTPTLIDIAANLAKEYLASKESPKLSGEHPPPKRPAQSSGGRRPIEDLINANLMRASISSFPHNVEAPIMCANISAAAKA